MEDLSGNKFNNWIVIEYCGKSEWLCECQCENKTRKKVRTYMLKSGGSKSCGCGRATLQEIDLTNKTFGYWKVLRKDTDRKRNYICLCTKCGQVQRSVFSGDLKSGKSVSCGCSTRVDITGKRYGELYVNKYLKEIYKYECKCDCGNTIYTTRYELENNRIKSCGKHSKYIDISGQKFNEWTAVSYEGNYNWLCECACGNKRVISRYDLINGKSTNCGHNRKEDLTNKRYGELIVNKYIGDCEWECICSCGKTTIVKSGNLKSGGTTSCGCRNVAIQHYKTKEQVIQCINDYIIKNNSLPYPEDIAIVLGVTSGAVYKYINKYELQDKFNKSFGSRPERDIYRFIAQYVNNIELHNRKILNGKELDIYIPSKKIAIEFNGDYWHSMEKLNDKYYHQNKTIDCAKQGIQLIHIFEYEWNDKDKQEKILRYLERLLKKENNKVIYARETEIKQILSTEANEFCNKYHLQGSTNATINLGCYYKDELVGVMTLGNPRFNSRYEYEIHRLCWKDSVVITGGAEKLFKHFIKTFNPQSIITYVDISKFTGNVYTRLGFKPIHPNPITEPNYVWISQDSGSVLQRYKTMKSKLIEQGLGTEEQTETEIMLSNNFMQIYSCGNLRLEFSRAI